MATILLVVGSCVSVSAQVSVERLQWVGSFDDSEKQELLPVFQSNGCGLRLFAYSQIVKDDLDGDGRSDFLANALSEDQREHVMALVGAKDGYRCLASASATNDPGIRRQRKIFTVDFDGDGMKDVVDQHQYDLSGEEAGFHAMVLKFTGESLDPVYSKDSFGALSFENLDADRSYELIEMTNEFKIPYDVAFWPIVYQWNGERFAEASNKFPDFYAGRAAFYREILSEAVADNEKFLAKTGRENPVKLNIVRAMEAYLGRIEAMLDADGNGETRN